jgi:hypothetical protein
VNIPTGHAMPVVRCANGGGGPQLDLRDGPFSIGAQLNDIQKRARGRCLVNAFEPISRGELLL